MHVSDSVSSYTITVYLHSIKDFVSRDLKLLQQDLVCYVIDTNEL